MSRYLVGVYDRAGEYFTALAPNRVQARHLTAIFKARWPEKIVEVHDMERDGQAIDPDDDEEGPDAA